MRLELAEGEYYHVFNRGVERRDIFLEQHDIARFIVSISMFNSRDTIGSIYETRFRDVSERSPIVEIIAYCLNPNHYHLLLKQVTSDGIQRFMQRLGTGYTNYFNEKNKRTGALFQGRYKAVHVDSNEQLLHTSVYVNLNNQLGSPTPKLSASSWEEYRTDKYAEPLCSKEVILGQFDSRDHYSEFALLSARDIVERKRAEKEIQTLFGS